MLEISERARRIGLSVTLLCAAAFFLYFVNGFYQVTHWLFWRYAGYWLGAAFWAASCFCLGHRVLGRLLCGSLRKTEQLMLAMPLGALSFGLAIFVLGLLHALNVVTFFALPAAFIVIGARGVHDDWRRLSPVAAKWLASPRTPWLIPAAVLATIAFALLYIQSLHPLGFTFDARWYHMTMAQRYALSHQIGPFPEGFWNAAWPHLFSYQYTWAFLAPLPILFDRLELCAHLEVITFVITVAQVPVVVRRLVPRAPVGMTWLAFFAFPGLFLYDSNLNGGADHFAALFALPIALCFWRAYRHFRAGNVAIFAAFAAAAALTKYTALPLAVIPAFVLLLRGAWLVLRGHAGALAGVGALVGVSLLLTAPNWAANLIWYGDPVYPMLHSHFPSRPWVPDTPSQLKFLHGTSRPGELSVSGLKQALQTSFTFSFVPNDWYIFHRDVPLFGSLFTLTLPCLLFLRGARRVWWLYAMSMLGVCMWFIISHYDRYLQAILPWMVGATACTFAMVWRLGGWWRLSLFPLVGLQVIWGSDAPFITSHNQVGDSPLRYVAKFLASGHEQVRGRFRVFEPLPSIGEAVPKDAVLLIHDLITILGTDRNWRSDLHQSRISYGLLMSPRAIDTELKAIGVTHLAWPNSTIYRDTVAGDLAFANYAANYAVGQKTIANFVVASLPARPPSDDRRDYEVAYFSCGSPYSSGMYKLSQLRLPVLDPGRRPKPQSKLPATADALERADMLVVDRRCHNDVNPDARFLHPSSRGDSELWVRRVKP